METRYVPPTQQPQYRETREVMAQGGQIVRLVYFTEFGGWVGCERAETEGEGTYNIPLFTPAYVNFTTFTDHDLKFNLGEIEDWHSMNEGLENQNYVDEAGENLWNARKFIEAFLGLTFGKIPSTS